MPNILEFIGMPTLTPIVAREQAFRHLEQFFPDEVLGVISSWVDGPVSLCDTVFFQILYVLAGAEIVLVL